MKKSDGWKEVKNPAAETAGRQSQNSNSLTCSRLSCPIVLSTSELRQRPQGVIVINNIKDRVITKHVGVSINA